MRRILFLNQFYDPSEVATAQYLKDVVDAIPEATVICATPGPHSPRVLRARSAPFAHDHRSRLQSYATYYLQALFHAVRNQPNTVVTMTTPPLLSLIGNLLQLRGARLFIWEMDLYPDIAEDLGVLKPNRLLRALATWSRRRATGIIALGQDMKDRLIAQGIPPNKIPICENWADGQQITPQPFPEGPLNIHYSGNFGLAHDAATIREAILALQDNPNFQFTFTGDGPRVKDIPTTPNVQRKPLATRDNLSNSLAQGHIGLVTQNPATVGSVVPSKTYGIMAAGRPILYIGPKQATPARIIEKHRCGWQIENGDTKTLLQLLEALNQDRTEIKTKGVAARQAFEQNYDLSVSVPKLIDFIGVHRCSSVAKK